MCLCVCVSVCHVMLCNVILHLNASSQGSDSGFKYLNTPSQGNDTELNIRIHPASAVTLI